MALACFYHCSLVLVWGPEQGFDVTASPFCCLPGCSNRSVLCFCYGTLSLECQHGFQVPISSCHFLLYSCSYEALFWTFLYSTCFLGLRHPSPLHSLILQLFHCLPLSLLLNRSASSLPPPRPCFLLIHLNYTFASLPSRSFMCISSHSGY